MSSPDLNTFTQAEQSNLKNFFDADIDFHWVLDNHGTILAINDTVRNRLGYSDDELVGQSILLVHPEDRREDTEKVVQAMLLGQERYCMVPIISKKGEQIPVETYITKGYWNDKPALFGISKDITVLKFSEQKFYKAFHISPNIIGISSLNTGEYIEVNQSFYDILGYAPEEVIGKKASEVVKFDDKYRIPIRKKLLEKGFVRNEEAVIFTKKGIPLNVLMSAEIITIQGKQLNYTIAVDITYRKQAEKILKESHIGLLSIFDTMEVPVYIADPTTYEIIYVNTALKELMGDPSGRKCHQYLQNLEEPCSFCTNKHILGWNFGKTYSWEFRNMVTGNWYKCLDKAILWPDRRIVRYEMAFDITAQKEAQAALREKMEILDATQRLAKIGGWEYDLAKQTMIWADETYLIHGLQRSDIAPGPDDLIQRSLSCYQIEDRPIVMELFTRCVAQGIPYNGEFSFTTFDGRKIWIQTMANAVFDNGNIVKVIGNIIDITEQKLTQDRLRVSEERLRMAHMATNDIVWDWDIVSDAQTWNSAGTLLLGWTDIVERPQTAEWWSEKIHPDDRQRVDKKFFSVLDDDATHSWEDEYRILKADGSYAEINDRGYIVRNEKGKATRMVGAMQDITERKRIQHELILAKEKAEESDRLKSAFLANMSHEIRTPMNGIMGFTELLKDPGLSSEQQRRFIDIIRKSGERLLNTVNDLIDISRIETGQMPLVLADVNLRNLIDELIFFFTPQAEQKGVNLILEFMFSPSFDVITTDQTKLESILVNLIKNAIKYTETGDIRVSCEEVEGGLKFAIKDTGIGIPDNRMDAIFNRFEQADISDTRAFQGSGLGLSIAKAYVEMLGGTLGVKSKEGVGSTFWFTIPYTMTPGTLIEKRQDSVQISPLEDSIQTMKKRIILIAEDDEDNYAYLSVALGQTTFELIHVTSGTETVELCRTQKDIDLILMDIKMPMMDGYEATRKIREFNKEVVIIAQTAYALTGDREKALQAGCNDYLAKPVSREKLLEMIRKYAVNST